MNENAKKWVEALRSGQYKQAQQTLRRHDSYCCLGVACEISGLGRWVSEGNGDHLFAVNERDCHETRLPYAVRDWLGLRTTDGRFRGEWDDPNSLIDMNDMGATFAQIADIIESKPEGLFE